MYRRQVRHLNRVHILLFISVVLSLFIFTCISQGLREKIRNSISSLPAGKPILHTIGLLPILLMCAVPVPLPVFYLLFYGMGNLTQLVRRKKTHMDWLIVNVSFLLFAVPHIIVLGLLALYIHGDVLSVLNDPSLRTLSLLLVILLASATSPILAHFLGHEQEQILFKDTEELHLFSRFVWFCVCSVLLDSIPCLFSLPTKFSALFLIGSNVLLLLMAFQFALHVYAIIRNAYLQDEYIRLQEEEVLQHSRMVRLEREAYLDVLTGLYTRAYASANLEDMLKNQEAFVLAFLDLDGLKQINDRHGHLAGDDYLRNFAVSLKENLRPNDIFARYGGDEFLLILPDCSLEDAQSLLSAIQSEISKSGFPFSYGLFCGDPDAGYDVEEWIAAADQAMYQNKKYRHLQKGGY